MILFYLVSRNFVPDIKTTVHTIPFMYQHNFKLQILVVCHENGTSVFKIRCIYNH